MEKPPIFEIVDRGIIINFNREYNEYESNDKEATTWEWRVFGIGLDRKRFDWWKVEEEVKWVRGFTFFHIAICWGYNYEYEVIDND